MAGIEAVLLLALQAILSGILVGGVYGILSVGLSLAFGVMRIVNFAHGELVMYGMYAGVIASTNFGVDPLLILPLSFLARRRWSAQRNIKSCFATSSVMRRCSSCWRLSAARSCCR